MTEKTLLVGRQNAMRGGPKGWTGLLEAFQLTSTFPANAFETKYRFARLENANLQLGADISVGLEGLNLPGYDER